MPCFRDPRPIKSGIEGDAHGGAVPGTGEGVGVPVQEGSLGERGWAGEQVVNDGLSRQLCGTGPVFGCGLEEDAYLTFGFFVFSGEARFMQEAVEVTLVKATKHV